MPGCITGSRPILHACAIRTAQTLTPKSLILDPPSLKWVKASANPVHRLTSNSSSGKSVRGRRLCTRVRSSSSDSGSSRRSRESVQVVLVRRMFQYGPPDSSPTYLQCYDKQNPVLSLKGLKTFLHLKTSLACEVLEVEQHSKQTLEVIAPVDHHIVRCQLHR